MIPERRGASHEVLLAVAATVVVVIGIPMFLGGGGEALKELMAMLFTPLGLILLLTVLLVIRYGCFAPNIFSTIEPASIHRASGSPVGLLALLLLVLFLLYYKFSIFGGNEDSDE